MINANIKYNNDLQIKFISIPLRTANHISYLLKINIEYMKINLICIYQLLRIPINLKGESIQLICSVKIF